MNSTAPNDWEPISAPSSVPNDFEPIAPPPTAAPSGPLPPLQADVQTQIDKAAAAHNVPDWALRSIAAVETGGDKDPTRAVNPQSQASGAMQLLPSTFATVAPHGQIFNLRDNVDAGARYYRQMLDKYGDPVKAAGAYNVGPKAFDAYLAGKAPLPEETVRYMARVAASQMPEDHAVPDFLHALTTPIVGTANAATEVPDDFEPIPSKAAAQNIGKRMPTQRNVNLDPTKAHHSPLSELAGHQDIPFILANAVAKDAMEGTGTKYRDEALSMWARDPAAASDMYGPNSKSMLELYAQKGSPFERAEAAYLLKNPWAAGGETFIEEMLNPVGVAEGWGAGRALGVIGGAVGKTVLGRQLGHFASPYQAIVGQFGENARNLIAQMGANINRRGQVAMETAQKIFGDLTQAEQHEVVRLKQGLHPNLPNRPDLAKRAALLHKTIVQITREQLASGVLDPKNVYDVNTFFPMRGAYDHPSYNDQTMSFLDQLRPSTRMGPQSPFAQPTTAHRTYATFDDSLRSPQFDPAKFVPATNLYHFLKARGGNVEFDNGIRRIAKAHPDLIRIGAIGVPTNRFGKQMIAAKDALGTVSPALAASHIAPEMVKFLTKGGAGKIVGIPDGAENLEGIRKAFAAYNGVMRGMIMMNPLYHPFWNIATNTTAASRAGIPGMMKNYGRAILGTAFSVPEFAKAIGLKGLGDWMGGGRDAIEKRFWTGAQSYARDMLAATRAGAMAEFGAGRAVLGGDPAKIRTLAPSSLSMPEKLDKFLTGIADWNTHATFGPRGEEAFASTLYKKFTGPGYRMRPEDAAWHVREALGNYQNVDRTNVATKLLFFYPWLKTNVPFWIKTALMAPRYATAPNQANARISQIAGDPKAEDPNHPRKGTQAYLGRDAEQEDVAYSSSLPFKDAEQLSNVLDPRPASMGGPSLNERVEDAYSMVASRLHPVLGLASDTLRTVTGKPAEPGTFQGYNTVYNNAAPSDEAARQAAVTAAEKLIPLPMPFVAQDLEREGFRQDRIGDYALEMASAGYISRTEAASAKRATSKALMQYETRKKNLDKRQRGSAPLSAEEYNARLQRFYDFYQKRSNAVRDRLAKKATETNATPKPVPSDFEAVPNDFEPIPR